MVEKKLKNSFRGYNKKDVHTYVEELDREMKAKISLFEDNLADAAKKAQETQESYERALKGKDSRIDELISSKVTSEKALEEANFTIDELTRKLSDAQEEIQNYRENIRNREEKTSELLEKISKLEAERSRIPAALMLAEEKAEELLGNAREKADIILDDASKLADKKLLSAENEYKKVMAESEDFKRKVIVSRQNLIAAMAAYKKALDDALSE